jgi:hypothetical protein
MDTSPDGGRFTVSANTDRHETAVTRCLKAWNTRGRDTPAKAVAAGGGRDVPFRDPGARLDSGSPVLGPGFRHRAGSRP